MTEYYIGRREQVAIVEEDGGYATLSSNTVANAGFIPGKNIQFDDQFNHEWEEVQSAGDDSLEVNSFEEGPVSYPFKMTFIVTDWRFLKYCAFGNVTNTGSNPYTHTFTLKSDVTSFTCEWARRGETDSVITLSGCVIRRVTLNFQSSSSSGEGFITATCDCIAKTHSEGSSVTSVSSPTTSPFHFRHATLTLGGSAITQVKSGELVIDYGINEEDSRYANATLDQEISEPIPTLVRYSSNFTLHASNNTYFGYWEDQTALSSTNTLVFNRGANDTMTFTFTNKYVKSASQPTNFGGVNTLNLSSVIETLAPVAVDSRNDY